MIKKCSGCAMLMRFALVSTCLAFLVSPLYAQAAEADAPIVTDNRIKTFVYNENEVFKLVMHYGFQSHIVFDKNEVIDTVSVGDSYAWKITPVENRIFVKPLEESSYTNMTVVTDKRTYQFDLVSKAPKENLEDGLVYMVRFFYPAGTFDAPHLASANAAGTMANGLPGGGSPMMPGGMSSGMPPMSGMLPMTDNNMSGMPPMQSPENMPMMPPSSDQDSSMMGSGASVVPSEPMPEDDYPDYKGGGGMSSMHKTPVVQPAPVSNASNTYSAPSSAPGAYNFDYTLTGPNNIAPERVFDDGQKTYFEFSASMPVPYISMVMDSGNEVPLNHLRQDGFIVVNAVAKKFSLRSGNNTVYVYNEHI